MYKYYVIIIGETLSGNQWYHFEYEARRLFKVGDLLYSDGYKSSDFGNKDFQVKFIDTIEEGKAYKLKVM